MKKQHSLRKIKIAILSTPFKIMSKPNIKFMCQAKCGTCGQKCESGHLFNPYQHYDEAGHIWGEE